MTDQTNLAEFRITFGQKYRREPHPTFPKAHPDGWLTILATDQEKARAIAVKHLGTAWAFDYRAESQSPEQWAAWFPLGELGLIREEEES